MLVWLGAIGNLGAGLRSQNNRETNYQHHHSNENALKQGLVWNEVKWTEMHLVSLENNHFYTKQQTEKL